MTGPDGRFLFERVPAGATIRAWRRGYRTAGDYADVWTEMVMPDSEPMKAELVRLGAVFGRVLDENGDPIMGLLVHLLETRAIDGKWRARRYAADITDDRGVFRLWYLNPGRYYLRIGGRGRLSYGIGEFPATRPAIFSYGPKFYPSGDSLEEAQRILVEPGATVEANLILNGQRGFTVRGRLQGLASGDYAQVRLLRGGASTGHEVRISQVNGAFEILGVPPGVYVIEARTQSSPPLIARLPVTVGEEDLRGVVLSLRPAPAVRVVVSGEDPLGRVLLQPENDPFAEPFSFVGEREDQEGSYRVEGVPPGQYRVSWKGGKGVVSIRSGTEDLLQAPLTVTEYGCEPVEIELASANGRLEVAVTGVPENRLALVLALREGFPMAPHHLEPASGPGKVATFRSLAPGRYRILAYLHGAEFAFYERGVVESVAEQSVVAEVAEGTEMKVTVGLLKLPEEGQTP